MPIRIVLVLTLSIFVGSSVIGCHRNYPLVEPSFTVAISNQATIHEAIRQALVSRRWSITKQTANSFDAEYQRSADVRASVRVNHHADRVTVKYLGSTNLGYTDDGGAAQINRRYNTWVTNLERDIQVEIGRSL
jgi:hypothetical protein